MMNHWHNTVPLNNRVEIVKDLRSKYEVFSGVFQMSQSTDGEKPLATGFDMSRSAEQRPLARNSEHFVLVTDELQQTGSYGANPSLRLELLSKDSSQAPASQREE